MTLLLPESGTVKNPALRLGREAGTRHDLRQMPGDRRIRRDSGKIRGMSACVNILPEFRSIYGWRGQTRDAGASDYVDWVLNETGSE
jgi:hypothetical protein